jgi:hypothetical protein
MSDTDIDKTTKDSAIPKHPPKKPTRDYSAIPQKPITLKQRGKKPVPKKQNAASKEEQQKDLPSPRKNAANPWHLEGISEEAKAAIIAGAESEGLSIAQYLEQLALRKEREAVTFPTQATDPEIHYRISAIEQRLDRMEKQRGFWGSFWDKVINTTD